MDTTPNTANASAEPSVNFGTLALQLTPVALRRPTLKALLRALVKPFDALGSDFDAFRANKRLRMTFNGQVRLLEHVANLLMVGQYDPASPAIYLDEREPVREFLIAPDGNWALQSSIHHDGTAKLEWDWNHPDPAEPPEDYSLLHDRTCRASTLGFEVHLTPPLSPAAPANPLKAAYFGHGGEATLRAIVDTYKLAGKQYTVVQD